MEINVTPFFNECNPRAYSGSVAELGQDAGEITWNNALTSGYNLLDTPEKLDAMRAWVSSAGAWGFDEAEVMPDGELNALFTQHVAGEMREKGTNAWDLYAALADAGQISGNLFKGTDGEIYYSLDA